MKEITKERRPETRGKKKYTKQSTWRKNQDKERYKGCKEGDQEMEV